MAKKAILSVRLPAETTSRKVMCYAISAASPTTLNQKKTITRDRTDHFVVDLILISSFRFRSAFLPRYRKWFY